MTTFGSLPGSDSVANQFSNIFGFDETDAVEIGEMVADDLFDTFVDQIGGSTADAFNDFKKGADHAITLASPIISAVNSVVEAAQFQSQVSEIESQLVQTLTDESPTYLKSKVEAYLSGFAVADPVIAGFVKKIHNLAVEVARMTNAANVSVDPSLVKERVDNYALSKITYLYNMTEAIDRAQVLLDPYLYGTPPGETKSSDSQEPSVINSQMDYLSQLSDLIAKYTGILYQNLSDDSKISLAISNATMSANMDQNRYQTQQTNIMERKNEALREKAEKAKKTQKWAGIGQIIAGTLLVALGAFIAVVGTPFTGGASVLGGGMLATMGASMVISGAMMYASSQNPEFGAKMSKGMTAVMNNEDAIIAASIIAAVAIIVTFGAASAQIAGVGAGAASFITGATTLSTTTAASAAAVTAVAATTMTTTQMGLMAVSSIGMISMAVVMPMLASTVQTYLADKYRARGDEDWQSKASKDAMIIMGAVSAAMMVMGGVSAGWAQAGSFGGMVSNVSNSMQRTAANMMSTVRGALVSGGTGSGGAAATTAATSAGATGAAAGGASVARSVGEVLSNVVKTIMNPITFTSLLQTSSDIVMNLQQADMLKMQAKIAVVKAQTDAAMTISKAGIESLSSMSQAILQSDKQISNQILAATQSFTSTMDSSRQMVTALFSGQAMGNVTQNSGAVSEDDKKKKVESKANLEAAGAVAAAAKAQVAVAFAGDMEGVESTKEGMNETSQTKALVALLALISILKAKIKEVLQQTGLDPDGQTGEAETYSTFLAMAIMKALSIQQKAGVPLPRELAEAALDNPALYALAILLGKQTKSKPGFDDLMGSITFTESSEDQQVEEMINLVKELSKGDPEMVEILQLLQALDKTQGSTPLAMAFKMAKAYASIDALTGQAAPGADAFDANKLLDEMLGAGTENLQEGAGDIFTTFGQLMGYGEEEKQEYAVPNLFPRG